MTNIQTLIVKPGTPELAICVRWRANAFSVLEASFEQELRSLDLFASDQSRGVALVAKADGEPVGTCLLVESEIEPNHDVSPWLAGLFVVPEHRRKGAGAALIRAKKVPLSLVPAVAIIHEARAFADGTAKHGGAYNWRTTPVSLMNLISKVQRHMSALQDGQDCAPDSGIHHAGHARADLAILLDALETGNLVDDRPIRGKAAELLERFAA
jgi:GNAT superfamily N-acetyltransferase